MLGDLEGEFAGRGQDECEDAGGVAGPFLEDWGGEGDGFAGASAGAADAVFACGQLAGGWGGGVGRGGNGREERRGREGRE